MMRQSANQLARRSALTKASSTRAFTVSARTMAAGDTGAPPQGLGQADAFQKREKASEDYAIRQREKEKLLELRKKLAEQQKNLDGLKAHIDEITKEQGGEQN